MAMPTRNLVIFEMLLVVHWYVLDTLHYVLVKRKYLALSWNGIKGNSTADGFIFVIAIVRIQVLERE